MHARLQDVMVAAHWQYRASTSSCRFLPLRAIRNTLSEVPVLRRALEPKCHAGVRIHVPTTNACGFTPTNAGLMHL